MKILVTGATGLVGSALVEALARDGHTVCRLVRPETRTAGGARGAFDVTWNPKTGELGGAAVGAEAVVNLAGASIAGGRWTASRKRLLRASRVDVTRALVAALGKMNGKPSLLVSASATGFYANRGDDILTESSTPGEGFLANLAKDWEAEALRAEMFRTRVVLPRFGIILAENGGALPKMMLPFRMGVGGRIASGQQWMPWVALNDVVEIIRFVLTTRDVRGPVNVVAPEPVRNADFTRALAGALHRPALVSVPALALKLVLGREMAEELLLASQRVVPAALTRIGYRFAHPQLQAALEAMVARR
ncbi:MAG TPA: TIGR01777 family oxidoreductase [Candidatus Acidoferrum sp.]|nr:TIGR01777 family oxidoreductase [Candidatus Acidoferrum sp.]